MALPTEESEKEEKDKGEKEEDGYCIDEDIKRDDIGDTSTETSDTLAVQVDTLAAEPKKYSNSITGEEKKRFDEIWGLDSSWEFSTDSLGKHLVWARHCCGRKYCTSSAWTFGRQRRYWRRVSADRKTSKVYMV